MSKATELDDYVRTHPLSPVEIREQQAAAEIGRGDLEVTLDGELIRRQPAQAPKVVQRPEVRTWD